jgi:hypothetical protein
MSKCGDGTVRVLQMTACPDAGWRAVFADETSATGYFVEPVACWLLVDHGGESHVHPATALATVVGDATEAANYLGVISPIAEPEELIAAINRTMPKTA